MFTEKLSRQTPLSFYENPIHVFPQCSVTTRSRRLRLLPSAPAVARALPGLEGRAQRVTSLPHSSCHASSLFFLHKGISS